MIETEINNRDDDHPKYKSLKVHQTILKNLKKDDLVVLTINGTEYFRCKVLYGSSAHVNVVLQDKGEKLLEMTPDQINEAQVMWRASQGEK